MKTPTKAQKRDRVFLPLFPLSLGLLVILLIAGLCSKGYLVFDEKRIIEGFTLLVGVWATLLGFLITAISIFLTLGDKETGNRLYENGHMNTILQVYIFSCIHLFVSIIVSLVIIVLEIYCFIIPALLCGFIIDTFVAVFLCLFILFGVIKKVS